MHDTTVLLVELGAVILGLGLVGRFAGRVGLSPIPLYLLGGLAFGHGGLFPLDATEGFIEIGAEIGVILLLLMLGLEYSASELVTNLRTQYPSGIVDFLCNALPGAIAALLLGWGATAAIALAGVTWISSSGVIAKVLTDLGRLGNRETPVILGVLVMEDLAMAVYLPLLTATLAGLGLAGGSLTLVIALGTVGIVLFVALRHGRLISRAVSSDNPEMLLLVVLGLTLLVAGIAQKLQVSAAVGAFLVGIAISGEVAENIRHLLTPLRDLFAAVFFVFFGLSTDPAGIPTVLVPALVLAVITTASKVYTGWYAAGRAGIGPKGRLRAGGALVARGEFSIVIAGLAAGVETQIAPIATAYVLLMVILGPLTARWTEPLVRRVRPSFFTPPQPTLATAGTSAGPPGTSAGPPGRESTDPAVEPATSAGPPAARKPEADPATTQRGDVEPDDYGEPEDHGETHRAEPGTRESDPLDSGTSGA